MNWDWGFAFDFEDFLGAPRMRRRRRGRGPRRGFFRQGEVRIALLSLLAEEPGHGYELMKRLEERSGGLYRASAGTVYPVLQQLEDEGLVQVRADGGKKVYEITETGRDELRSKEERVERIWRRAKKWEEWGCRMGPDTIEVGSAIGRLTKTAFVVASASEEKAEQVLEVLRRSRKELEKLA